MLENKKTYISAALLGFAAFARGMGWIEQSTFEAIGTFLAACGLAALRAGVSKSGQS